MVHCSYTKWYYHNSQLQPLKEHKRNRLCLPGVGILDASKLPWWQSMNLQLQQPKTNLIYKPNGKNFFFCFLKICPKFDCQYTISSKQFDIKSFYWTQLFKFTRSHLAIFEYIQRLLVFYKVRNIFQGLVRNQIPKVFSTVISEARIHLKFT